jgi:hypothetical protein
MAGPGLGVFRGHEDEGPVNVDDLPQLGANFGPPGLPRCYSSSLTTRRRPGHGAGKISSGVFPEHGRLLEAHAAAARDADIRPTAALKRRCVCGRLVDTPTDRSRLSPEPVRECAGLASYAASSPETCQLTFRISLYPLR